MPEDNVPRRQFLLGAGLAGTAIAAGMAEPVERSSRRPRQQRRHPRRR